MRLAILATTAAVLTLPAQTPPEWMTVFDKARPAPGQGYVPLGAHDAEVEGAWAAALAAGPDHRYFVSAAQQSANYFLGQGYTRKAEAILRQAIAVSPLSGLLVTLLSQQLKQQQRLIAAAAVLQDFLSRSKELSYRASCLRQLASLREEIGDLDAVEPLLREADSLPSGAYNRLSGSGISAPESAQFQLRQGDTTKAEALFKQSLSNSKTQTERFRNTHSYAAFLIGQKRAGEAVALWEQLLSHPESKPMLLVIRMQLAAALTAAGQTDKSLAVARESLAAAPEDGPERRRALIQYADLLVRQKKFDDAEMVVEQLRQAPAGATLTMVTHYGRMADGMLAQVRLAQGRPEEARVLRAKSMPPLEQRPSADVGPPRSANPLSPFHSLTRLGKYDEAIALLTSILADSGPRIQADPSKFSELVLAIFDLPADRKEQKAKLTVAAISLLDAIRPADHPRVAEALSYLANRMVDSGLPSPDTTQILTRLEKLVASNQGEDSPALSEVSLLRARHFSRRGNHPEAGIEIKKALAQTEATAGPNSQPVLLTARHALMVLQASNENWPQEEALRLKLIAADKQNPISDMQILATRYAANGQRDNAVVWIDRAIEVAKKNPQLANNLPHLQESRAIYAAPQ